MENLDKTMNYAAKFSGYGGEKVVKSRRNFIYKKRNPGRIGFHISEKRKEFFSQKHPLGRRIIIWVLLRKSRLLTLNCIPSNLAKRMGWCDIAPIMVRGVRTPRIIANRHNNYYGFVVFTHPLIVHAHCSGSSRI